MNQKLPVLVALLTLSAVPLASAFTYSDSDLLLVFRKDGFSDVLFNLGSVSQYLTLANGTKVSVTNWDLSLVKSTYNQNISGVKFILTAVTSISDSQPRLWCTDASLASQTPPTDLPGSRWRSLRGKLAAVGQDAAIYTATNAGTSYVIAPTDASAYTFIASDGGSLDVATICGFAPFSVQTDIPGKALFYELKASTATPRPAAKLMGSFSFDDQGSLTFVAGAEEPPLPELVRPKILSITRAANTASIQFTTTNNLNYRLWYCDQLGAVPTWSVKNATVTGDGAPKVLVDEASGSQRIYQVEVRH
jgi:hypothetical protein